MRRLKIVGLVGLCLLAAAVSVAGYFFEEPKVATDKQATRSLDDGRVAASRPDVGCDMATMERVHSLKHWSPGAAQGQTANVAFGTDGRAYQREASLSVRVNDVFEALSSVEKLAGDAKGYLETIDVSGTPQTHDGRIVLTVPSDRFTEVFGSLRKLGDLLTERITAQMVQGNRAAGGEVKDATVELVRIDLSLSDNPERLAKTEVKGLLAGAWQRSMEHFGKGGAVLLEAFGFVLPFVLSFAAILIVVCLFGLGARVYAKIAAPKIPYAVPAES